MNIHIIKNLNIKDDADNNERAKADLTSSINNLKRHVIGTKTSDLSQIYNGKVVIQGSLTIQDVQFNSMKSKIFVNGSELLQNISENYWMKSVKQNVRVDRFTVNNLLKTENILTHSLREFPVVDLVMLDAKITQGLCNMRFKTAIIEGDIKGHNDNIPSLIYHLNFTAVPRQGDFRLVQSSIVFRGNISVRKLETKFINKSLVSELAYYGQKSIVFTAPKILRSLEVKNMQIYYQVTAGYFNNLDLQQFLHKAVRIDHPIEIQTLKLARFEAKTLVIKFFEEHLLNEFISSLEKEFQLSSDGSASVMRNLRVVGKANFLSNIFINTINGQEDFNDLCNFLVLKNETKSNIGGTKVFRQSVIVTENVEAKLVNNFPLDSFIHHSLSKGEKQTINGELFVRNLKMKSLKAKTLNNITYNQFIDKNMLELPLVMNLNVDILDVNHVVSKSSLYNTTKMMELVQFPNRSYWNYVNINGDLKIPLHSASYLDLIASTAVFKKGLPQAIAGNVQIFTSKFFIKHFSKPDSVVLSQFIPIDIQELFLDSLKSESSEKSQVIRGIKTFQSPIYVKDLKIEPQAYFESKKINNVDVLHLNLTIIRSDVVQSKKYFGQIHADEIIIEGKLNGIPWNSMVFVTKNDLKLPQLTIEHLEVYNLETQSLNDYWLRHFLVHRMRKHGEPTQHQQIESFVTFCDLDLVNDTIISSINTVGIDDGVYSTSDQLQEINGHKWIAGNINIVGPSTISAINFEDFGLFVRNSIWRTKDHTVSYMDLPAVELEQGLQAKNTINGYRIDELLSSDTHTPKIVDLTELVRQIRQYINDLNSAKKARTVKPKRLLYVDFDPTVQFEFEGTRERSSENYCGEKIVEPSKYNAILVTEKRYQNMTIELPSATIVTIPNFDCRNNFATSKEIFTMMTYKSRNLTVTEPFKFENFIADVKFLEPRKEVFMMILTMQGAMDHSTEIFIEKLDETVQENWFEHQKISDLNFITKSRIIETSKNRFLVVSSFTDTTPATSDFLMILEHDPKTDKFVESQKKISGEKFDIILGVTVAPKSSSMKSRSFLLLARERSKVLYIYRLKEGSREFVFQRKIPFESDILEVVVLQIIGDAPYFIVSQQSGEFCLFEWRGIESWKAKQCGHFMNINQIRSYEYLKRQHLFLTSTMNSGTALSVYRQGEIF